MTTAAGGARVRLLAPASEVRFVGPMAMPAELYFLARQPVALAGMAYPSRVDWNALYDEGLRHVVCLTHDKAPYDPDPLTVTAIALQDLYTGVTPDDPAAELDRIARAATIVVDSLAAGDGVAVHCRGGRGRASATSREENRRGCRKRGQARERERGSTHSLVPSLGRQGLPGRPTYGTWPQHQETIQGQ